MLCTALGTMAKLDGSDCLLLCCVAWPATAARLVRIAETLMDPMVRSVALAYGHLTAVCVLLVILVRSGSLVPMSLWRQSVALAPKLNH